MMDGVGGWRGKNRVIAANAAMSTARQIFGEGTDGRLYIGNGLRQFGRIFNICRGPVKFVA